MISKKLGDLLNDQVNFEYYSAYIYFSMAAQFKHDGLNGFSNWMNVQTQEELCHGTAMLNHLVQRGFKPEMKAIPQPPVSWKSPLSIFENALEHEEMVTKRIHGIAAAAESEKDFALLNFIQWFISEQVEEEANANEIIGQLRLIGEAKGGLFMMDKELGARKFALPVIPGGGLAQAGA